jgi:hypothetical protein
MVAGVIDAGSGEVQSQRAADAGSSRLRGGADWVRACACVCRGGDPSRIRPAADRVKTDRRECLRGTRVSPNTAAALRHAKALTGD